MDKGNLPEKFARFTDPWKPKIVGELNGQQVKLDGFHLGHAARPALRLLRHAAAPG